MLFLINFTVLKYIFVCIFRTWFVLPSWWRCGLSHWS